MILVNGNRERRGKKQYDNAMKLMKASAVGEESDFTELFATITPKTELHSEYHRVFYRALMESCPSITNIPKVCSELNEVLLEFTKRIPFHFHLLYHLFNIKRLNNVGKKKGRRYKWVKALQINGPGTIDATQAWNLLYAISTHLQTLFEKVTFNKILWITEADFREHIPLCVITAVALYYSKKYEERIRKKAKSKMVRNMREAPNCSYVYCGSPNEFCQEEVADTRRILPDSGLRSSSQAMAPSVYEYSSASPYCAWDKEMGCTGVVGCCEER